MKPQAKIAEVEYGKLCDWCAEIDFHEVLAAKSALGTSRPMVDIIRSADCILCRFISDCWNALGASEVTKDTAQAYCDLYRAKLSALVQGFEDEEYTGICIWLERTRQFPELVLEPFSLERNRRGPQLLERRLSALGRLLPSRFGRGPSGPAPMLRAPRRMIRDLFDLDVLRFWLAECDISHPNHFTDLKKLISRGPALRVIDVLRDEMVTLHNPAAYVALSYVWGKKSWNREAAFAGTSRINRKALPRTLLDAMQVTEAIGQRYLWIDSICIDQKHPDEVAATVASMGAIYEYAYLTIIAASGDVNTGLSRLSAPSQSRFSTRAISFKSKGRQIALILRPLMLHEVWKSSIWATRGWTYQELAMSSRFVVFSEQEVFFECLHGTRQREAYETLRDRTCGGRQVQRTTSGLQPMELNWDDGWRIQGNDFQAYRTAVEVFSRRDLSFAGDRLDAFMGVLTSQYVAGATADASALAGLSPQYFRAALGWTTELLLANRKVADYEVRRTGLDTRKTQVLPSWSWAGWTDAVDFVLREERVDDPPTVRDAANVIFRLSSTPWDGQITQAPIEAPLRCALHLWATCVTVKFPRESDREVWCIQAPVGEYNRPGKGYSIIGFPEQVVLTTKTAFFSKSLPSETDTEYWIAELDVVAGLWLVFEGPHMNAERIGILYLQPAQRELALEMATERYSRIF